MKRFGVVIRMLFPVELANRSPLITEDPPNFAWN